MTSLFSNRRNIRRGRVLYTVAALCFCGSASGQGWEMPPARVETATAELRELSAVVEVSGTVISLNDSRIASEVEGVLAWVAEVGDAVDKGHVIARIDPRLMQVDYARAKANVARLESEHEYREKQLERTEELATLNSASKTLLDEAKANRDQAMHQLADARAQLERAEGDLARTQIRAAFAGHVTERLASVGEYLTVGDDVLRLVDTHKMEIALPAPIALTQFINPGSTVSVRSNGITREHKVRAVVPVGDIISRQVEVRLDAGNSNWLVGTPVQVSLPSDVPVTTVAVPRDALVERGGQRFIYKVSADNTAEQVIADVRVMVGLWVGLASGVANGDRVIIRGAERLSPGQSVEVIEQVSSR